MKTGGGDNVVELLRRAALQHPERLALAIRSRGRGSEIGFGELWRQVAAFGEALQDKGLRPGDRAIVMIPMSIDLYVVLLAVLGMGGVAVFVDPWVGYRQIAAFCTFAGPRAFIGTGKSHLLRLLDRRLLAIPLTISSGPVFAGCPARYSLPGMLRGRAGAVRIHPAAETDPALITFTSGSSGVPKGVNRTHGFLRAQYRALQALFPTDEGERDMPMFPVFALRNLAGGISSIIPEMDFRKVAEVDAAVIHRQILEQEVTSCTASPPFFNRLSAHVLEGSGRTLPLKRILTGGASVDPATLVQWRRAFPDTAIEIVYGSSEAEPVAHISLAERLAAEQSPAAAARRGGYCLGRICPLIAAKIIKIHRGAIAPGLDWSELEPAPGEIGELVVSGAHVCKDYYNNPQAVLENKLVAASGQIWHRMGDTGYFDESGRFWLVGRLHSTIVRNGEMLHAQLLEQQVAALFPSVPRVAVVGLPVGDDNEELAVVLVGEQLLERGAAAALLTEQGIPVDRLICRRRGLPLDPRHNAKIDYARLRREILAEE